MKDILCKWPKRGKEIQILGPAEAPLSKIRGKYRWQIFVKSRGTALLHHFIDRVAATTHRFFTSSGVTMTVDVDPYQML